MAKPSITTRTGKGSPLNYSELDTNFTNLRDATLTVTDGTNSTAIDLNGTIEFAAGANMTVTESGGVITLASTAGGSGALETETNNITLTSANTPYTVYPNENKFYYYNLTNDSSLSSGYNFRIDVRSLPLNTTVRMFIEEDTVNPDSYAMLLYNGTQMFASPFASIETLLEVTVYDKTPTNVIVVGWFQRFGDDTRYNFSIGGQTKYT